MHAATVLEEDQICKVLGGKLICRQSVAVILTNGTNGQPAARIIVSAGAHQLIVTGLRSENRPSIMRRDEPSVQGVVIDCEREAQNTTYRSNFTKTLMRRCAFQTGPTDSRPCVSLAAEQWAIELDKKWPGPTRPANC